MDNKLIRLGLSLGKNAKESDTNTKRIAANLPQIERKLDIVSNAYNFQMDVPLTDGASIAELNLYIRPDNCCDCDSGSLAGFRKGDGSITRWVDINGNDFLLEQPADCPQSGVDFRGVITSFQTVGVLDSIWFAWPGYPFFYPNGVMKEDFDQNAYGDLILTPEGTILVPTAGLYNITFSGHASGYTTDLSKITLTIKAREYGSGDPWEVISKEIDYTIYESLAPNSMMIAHDLKIWAICYGLPINYEISVWVASELIDNLSYGDGTIEVLLVGQGFGIITGYVRYLSDLTPIEGASVRVILPGEYGVPVLTDSYGKYTITRVPPGIHTVQATYGTHPNDHSGSRTAVVEANKVTTQVNFEI